VNLVRTAFNTTTMSVPISRGDSDIESGWKDIRKDAL